MMEAVDIDDVLRESEALLTRLKSNKVLASSDATVDSFSLASGVTSLVIDSNRPQSAKCGMNAVEDYISKDSSPPRATSTATDEGGNVAFEGRSAKWEKVSSAAQGDEDYVPIVDYSRKKVKTNPEAALSPKRFKVSRLEAFREKTRKRQRRQRRVFSVLFVSALFTLFLWWRKGKREGQIDLHQLKHASHPIIEPPVESETSTALNSSQTSEAENFKSCEKNFQEEFEQIISKFKNNDENTEEQNHDSSDISRTLHSHVSTKDTKNVKNHSQRCKIPLMRFFLRRCRRLAQEKKLQSRTNR